MNIKQAKEIRIVDFLERIGHTPTRQSTTQSWYLSPFRGESTASFKVNTERNLWFDFGSGEGGDLINLVQELEQLATVPEALLRIEAIMGGSPDQAVSQPSRKPVTKESKFEVNSVAPIQSKLLFAYLRRRGIDPKLAMPYLKQANYKVGDTEHVALAFANDLGGYDLRSIHSKLTHGSKAIRTIERKSDVVQVYEGFFDFLSSLMVPTINKNCSVIVLNSVAMKDQAIAKIKELGVSRVEVFRDRDHAGQEFFDKLVTELPDVECVDRSPLYDGFKDLNEWHVATNSIASSMPQRRKA